MPTSKSVDSIKASLMRPATTSHFYVEVGLPQGSEFSSYLEKHNITIPGNAVLQDKLNLLCSEAVLPGMTLTTMDITNDRTGVTEKHAYRKMFDDRIDLTFYVDAENYLPIKFFESWMSFIAGENDEGSVTRNDKSYYYRMTYPDDYMSDQGLKIYKFERDTYAGPTTGNVLTYQFIRAFPLSISSMPITYDASSLLKCNVSFSYIRYFIQETAGPESGNLLKNLLNPSQAINAGIPNSAIAEAARIYNETNASISPEARARGVTAGAVSLGGQFASEAKVF